MPRSALNMFAASAAAAPANSICRAVTDAVFDNSVPKDPVVLKDETLRITVSPSIAILLAINFFPIVISIPVQVLEARIASKHLSAHYPANLRRLGRDNSGWPEPGENREAQAASFRV
jgi:hypothetical protein